MIVKVKQKSKRINGQLYRAREYMVHEHMAEMLSRVPEAFVISSWRSLKEQKAMVAKGASKTLQSNHMRGVAVDVANWSEVQDKMRSIGLFNDITWDRNHFTIGGERKAAQTYPIIPSVSNPPYYRGKAKAPNIIIESPKNMAKYPKGSEEFITRMNEFLHMTATLPGMPTYIQKNEWSIEKLTGEAHWYCENKTNPETWDHWRAVVSDHQKKHPEVYGSGYYREGYANGKKEERSMILKALKKMLS